MPLRRRNPPRGSASSRPTALDADFATPGSRTLEPTPQASDPAPASAATNVLFQQLIETCIEQARDQVPARPRDESDRPLKPRNPDLYYGNSHMECYLFCQQCEDHFETAGAQGHKRVPFAAGFLKGRILNRWQQHKTRSQRNRLAPLSWVEFKAFLRKSLGESTGFVDNIWSNMKRDSQYQFEEVQDWAAHLEHLQSILMEFDTDYAPSEGVLGRYFYEGLRPSIKLWIVEEGRELDGWDDLIKKATRAEAKAKIQGNRDLDQRCPRGNRPIYTTIGKNPATQDCQNTTFASVEDTQSAGQPNSELESFVSNISRSQSARSETRSQTNAPHKMPWRQRKEQHRLEQGRNPARKDLSHIICFDCDKSGHYADKCTEPRANSSEK